MAFDKKREIELYVIKTGSVFEKRKMILQKTKGDNHADFSHAPSR
jgi:hypothetical protein